MRAKAMFIVLVGALSATGLLAVRQHRLQAVHAMTQALDRAGRADRALWGLRAQIAARVTPEEVRRLCAGLGPMQTIILDPAMPTTDSGWDALVAIDLLTDYPVQGVVSPCSIIR